jgi:metallo-beta-lactamase superfamily protein
MPLPIGRTMAAAYLRMEVFARLTTHGIGQGLFTSGMFSDDPLAQGAWRFDFVYDCGSVSNDTCFLNREIDRYREQVLQVTPDTDRPLDLLILSHLHYDHVGGLKRLLVGVRTALVVIPYLSPIERLLLAASEDPIDDEFYDVLLDPMGYLVRNGARRVLVISRGQRAMDPPPPEISDSGNEEVSRSREVRGETPAVRINAADVERMEADPVSQARAEADALQAPTDEVLSHTTFKTDSRALSAGDWEFAFYCTPIPEEKIDLFRLSIQMRFRNVLLRDILTKPKLRKELKELYQQLTRRSGPLSGDLNNTSLVLLHGPGQGHASESLHWTNGPGTAHLGPPADSWRAFSPRFPDLITRIASGRAWHLLTGDIDLSDQSRLDEMRTHLGQRLARASVVLLPHHGSELSWNSGLIRAVPVPGFAVISAGIGNKYGHPATSVLRDLITCGWKTEWANQFSTVTERIHLT